MYLPPLPPPSLPACPWLHLVSGRAATVCRCGSRGPWIPRPTVLGLHRARRDHWGQPLLHQHCCEATVHSAQRIWLPGPKTGSLAVTTCSSCFVCVSRGWTIIGPRWDHHGAAGASCEALGCCWCWKPWFTSGPVSHSYGLITGVFIHDSCMSISCRNRNLMVSSAEHFGTTRE